jgi:hypothetical protein
VLLNYIPCANEGADVAKSLSTCFVILIDCHLRPSKAETRPDGTLDDFLNVLSFNQVILDIKPFFHPGPGPSFSECRNWMACIGSRNESITTEVVVILLLAGSLHFVQKFMHASKTPSAWFQSLPSHSPNKQTHPDYSFRGKLMKKDLKRLQYFNQDSAQREPKPYFQKASVNNHLIYFRSRSSAVSSNPHNNHVAEVSSSHRINMTLFDSRFSEDGMAWSPWPIFRIFVSTFCIILITVIGVFRQISQYFSCNFLCVRFCHGFKKPSYERIRNFFLFKQLRVLSYLRLLSHLLLLRHGENTSLNRSSKSLKIRRELVNKN